MAAGIGGASTDAGRRGRLAPRRGAKLDQAAASGLLCPTRSFAYLLLHGAPRRPAALIVSLKAWAGRAYGTLCVGTFALGACVKQPKHCELISGWFGYGVVSVDAALGFAAGRN